MPPCRVAFAAPLTTSQVRRLVESFADLGSKAYEPEIEANLLELAGLFRWVTEVELQKWIHHLPAILFSRPATRRSMVVASRWCCSSPFAIHASHLVLETKPKTKK